MDDFEKLNTEICITTENGSLGKQGIVTNPVRKFIDPSISVKILEGIRDYCEKNDISDINDLIGTLKV